MVIMVNSYYHDMVIMVNSHYHDMIIMGNNHYSDMVIFRARISRPYKKLTIILLVTHWWFIYSIKL